jgi:hypothetical protein
MSIGLSPSNRETQLPGHHRQHVIRRIVVRMHPARRAWLGVIAKNPEVLAIHDGHRRDAGVAGHWTRLFGARPTACA